jgi:ribosomal protein L30/L7E
MIAIIRIAGKVGLRKDFEETFQRMNLRRKYSCAIIEKPNQVELGMIKKISDLVAFGEIDEKTLEELKKKREAKNNVFRLHPPRGGIDSKKHFGVKKGVLGNNKKEINKLILRML